MIPLAILAALALIAFGAALVVAIRKAPLDPHDGPWSDVAVRRKSRIPDVPARGRVLDEVV